MYFYYYIFYGTFSAKNNASDGEPNALVVAMCLFKQCMGGVACSQSTKSANVFVRSIMMGPKADQEDVAGS